MIIIFFTLLAIIAVGFIFSYIIATHEAKDNIVLPIIGLILCAINIIFITFIIISKI